MATSDWPYRQGVIVSDDAQERVRRALLALEPNPAWRDLREALARDRDGLRRQLENLPVDATLDQIRSLTGEMRGLSRVLDKPQRVMSDLEARRNEARRSA